VVEPVDVDVGAELSVEDHEGQEVEVPVEVADDGGDAQPGVLAGDGGSGGP
jgi:hypothetical protein